MEKNDKSKKQIPLRLSPSLYEKLVSWAEDDFRSVNGQIEYLLTESVKKRYGKNALFEDDKSTQLSQE